MSTVPHKLNLVLFGRGLHDCLFWWVFFNCDYTPVDNTCTLLLLFQDELSENVRDFADLDDTCPMLIILDSPEQNVYVCPDAKLSPQVASLFVDSFLQGELTPTPIPPMMADENLAECPSESQAEAVV